MTSPLSLMTDEEVRGCRPADEEPGFGALSTGRGHLPLQAMDVQVQITGLLSEVTISQTYRNTHGEPLEATYIYPLPDRFAVARFRLEVAGRVIEGQLQERGAARRQYTEAIRAGHRAAITEEERPGVFTMRVGNLPAGEEAVVTLTLVGPLPVSDGEATFRFPLVVAPRYIPGQALAGPAVGSGVAPDTDAVPDASRITPPVLLPGYPNPVRLALTVDVDAAGLAIGDIRSSLHGVCADETGAGRWRIALRAGERLDRDFILRFRICAESVQTALLLRPDLIGGGGTFLLTLVPPVGPSRAVQRSRDVIFLLDRSGSMAGWKMVAARRALARMVDTLTDHDRFAVYAFDDHVETPDPCGTSLVTATDRQRFRAVEFLAKIESRNGTELLEPLERALQQLTDGARDRVVVLVTDGQVGNEDQILRQLGPRLKDIRVFTLGIDQAVNAGFLQRLAQLGGGRCELVESEDRLDAVMDQVHRHIATPVVSHVRLRSAGSELDLTAVVPSRLPDLFASAPVLILGRYRGRGEQSLVVEGRDAAEHSWSQRVAGQVSDSRALACIWARGRIRELEDQFAMSSAPELERQIVETSLRYGVLSRFTAFVAVDRAEVVNEGGQQHQVTQAVEQPAGWGEAQADGILCRAARPAPHAMAAGGSAGASVTRSGSARPEMMDMLARLSKSAPPPAAATPPPGDSESSDFDDESFDLASAPAESECAGDHETSYSQSHSLSEPSSAPPPAPLAYRATDKGVGKGCMGVPEAARSNRASTRRELIGALAVLLIVPFSGWMLVRYPDGWASILLGVVLLGWTVLWFASRKNKPAAAIERKSDAPPAPDKTPAPAHRENFWK